MEFSGGTELVGGGGSMKTQHPDGLSWTPCQVETAHQVLGTSKEKPSRLETWRWIQQCCRAVGLQACWGAGILTHWDTHSLSCSSVHPFWCVIGGNGTQPLILFAPSFLVLKSLIIPSPHLPPHPNSSKACTSEDFMNYNLPNSRLKNCHPTHSVDLMLIVGW